MKFTAERDLLVNALTRVSKAAASRGLPVLSGVKMTVTGDSLAVLATDLELTLTDRVEVSDTEDGASVAPAKTFTDVVKSLPSGPVTVTVADDQATVRSGRAKFSVRLLPLDEFPDVDVTSGDQFTIAADELASSLARVVGSASSDENRPALNGVLFEAVGDKLRFVATDSYRLALCDTDVDASGFSGRNVLVPARAMSEVAKSLPSTGDVTVSISENTIGFASGSASVTSRLIVADFPRYQGLIPESNPFSLTVSAADLSAAVSRVKLLAGENTGVKLNLSTSSVSISARLDGVGDASEEIDGDYVGDDLTVAFNANYLSAMVASAAADKIVLSLRDALKPALVTTIDGDGFVGLVMPVRTN